MPADATEGPIEYLTGLCRSVEAPLLMIAQNGNMFDQPRLLAFLRKYGNHSDLQNFEEKIFWGDSYPVCRKALKEKLTRST